MAENDKPKAAKPAKPDEAAKAPGKAEKSAKPAKTGKPAKEVKVAKAPATAVQGKLPTKPRPKDYKPRMKLHYEKVVRQQLTKQFGYKNIMQVPRIDKIVINMGVGEAVGDRKKVDNAANDLALIAGQRPVITRAR